MQRIVDWAKENYRTLSTTILAAAILVGGVSWYRWHRASSRQDAAEGLRLGVALFYSARQTERPDYGRALYSLKRVIESYPGSAASAQAALYLGHIYFSQGDYNASLEHYKEAASSLRPSSFFLEIAMLDVAYTLEAKGEYEEAIAAYQKTLDLDRGLLKDRAVLGIGRCYEQQGNLSAAIETYNAMLKRFPNSPWAEELRQRLEALQGTKAKPS